MKSVSVGDHVVVDPNFYCGTCHNCRLGRTNVCQNLVELGVLANGGFAQYLYAPERFVIKIPREMDWTTAAVAEPLSCVIHGFLKASVHPGETAIVYGAGPIGLLWVYLFRRAGARKIAAVDIAPKRLEAAGKMGADILIDPMAEEPVAQIKKETEGFGAEVSVEAIGKVETVESTVRSLGPGGHAVLMGVAKHDTLAKLSPIGIMAREWEIIGTNSQIHSFPDAINILSSGEFPTSTFVSHRMPLKDINKAIEMNLKAETLKTIIDTA